MFDLQTPAVDDESALHYIRVGGVSAVPGLRGALYRRGRDKGRPSRILVSAQTIGRCLVNLKRLTAFLLAAIILNAGVAWAGALEDAVAAIDKKDYATASRLVTPLAQRGNAGAQRILGFMYMYELGKPRDYVRAYMWWTFAAANGDSQARGFRDSVAPGLSADQLAEAKKLVSECTKKKFKGCD